MNIPFHAGTLRRHLAGAAFAALLLPLGPPALAETPSAATPAAGTPAAGQASSSDQGKAQRELDAVREQQRQTAEAAAKLQAEVESISEDRSKLNKALIETAGRIRALETRMGASEARIKALD